MAGLKGCPLHGINPQPVEAVLPQPVLARKNQLDVHPIIELAEVAI